MLTEILKRLRDNPVEFVKRVLKAEPDPWQVEALNALATNKRVAIRSCHGVGKTALESWSTLWFLMTRYRPKIICTAPTAHQLRNVLMGELNKWLRQSPLLTELFDVQKTSIRLRADPENWCVLARSANRPENIAGFHSQSILFVIDEASGVDDEIFEAIQGALTTSDAKLLICGNPTRNTGFFRDAFFNDRDSYFTMKVSYTDSPRVTKDYSERMIKSYGIDSNVVRVRVLGEFPTSESDGLIALELIEAAVNRELEPIGELVIGVDVARFGDDETVIQPRIGDVALNSIVYRKADLMTTCGRIVRRVQELLSTYKLGHATINVDDDGVGGGVTDRLREVFREKNLRVEVNPCHNGGKARDKHYRNWAAETWFNLRDRFVSGNISIPRDEVLTAQLSTRKYRLSSDDRLQLEPKPDYKKRTGRSPDRADALVLAFAQTSQASPPPNFPMMNSYWR